MDGGYLIPDDLEGVDACFSPGTNNFKRFEDELYNGYAIKSFMCDFSSSIENFQTPLIEGAQHFEKKWLDIQQDEQSIRLDDWVDRSAPGGSDLILQMDIEGAEYRNLIATSSRTIARFRIIVLELHDLGRLSQSDFLDGVFLPAIRRLTESHVSVHVHANNACGETRFSPALAAPNAVEVTFLRRDRLRPGPSTIVLPNPLDQLNVYSEPPIVLRGPWARYAEPVGSRLAFLEQSVEYLTARTRTLSRHNSFLIRQFVPRGENLALRAKVSQSSRSAYSHDDDARGAANGLRTGSYGFHTEIETRPWWMADLGEVQRLEACLIFNRMDGASVRARNLELATSCDGQQWSRRYSHAGQPVFGGVDDHDGMPPLVVDLRGVSARFLKLELAEHTALHLDEVEIYGRPGQA